MSKDIGREPPLNETDEQEIECQECYKKFLPSDGYFDEENTSFYCSKGCAEEYNRKDNEPLYLNPSK